MTRPPDTDGSTILWALEVLDGHGLSTIVWANDQMTVVGRYGRLAPELSEGVRLCEACFALIGLDAEISALQDTPMRRLEIPNISVISNGAEANGSEANRTKAKVARLNYVVVWVPERQNYVLLISETLAENDISVELQRQVRRRMLMEAELVEQARAIQSANEDLCRANQDLADFARIISHDLKSPMRALRYYADDLERALRAPSEEDDPHSHLDRLRGQSRRMSSMLTGLLSYTRLEKKQEAVTVVNPRAMIETILASLPRPPSLKVEIVGEWQELQTYEAIFDLVVRNVLDNAIKYHDTGSGTITLQATPHTDGKHLEISISDDGPGIPLHLQKAILNPFTQVGRDADDMNDETDDYDAGMGMGLTLVKRACEVVGATISVHSNPRIQRGATFTLLWPRDILL